MNKLSSTRRAAVSMRRKVDALRKESKIPEFTDEYFDSLPTRGNYFANKSFSKHISNGALTVTEFATTPTAKFLE